MEIDNRNVRLGDELKKELKPNSKVKMAAATFKAFKEFCRSFLPYTD